MEEAPKRGKTLILRIAAKKKGIFFSLVRGVDKNKISISLESHFCVLQKQQTNEQQVARHQV